MGHDDLAVGDTFTHSRSIEVGDIQAFAELTQDRGVHHSAEQQPAIAHGLLTASVATKIGGDLDFLSREMQMTFLLPVRAGDVVEATVTITSAERPRQGRQKIAMEIVCRNQHEVLVLAGTATGYVPARDR
jgi:3-hydroxybutyryl-CoA dehydratase